MGALDGVDAGGTSDSQSVFARSDLPVERSPKLACLAERQRQSAAVECRASIPADRKGLTLAESRDLLRNRESYNGVGREWRQDDRPLRICCAQVLDGRHIWRNPSARLQSGRVRRRLRVQLGDQSGPGGPTD